MRFRLLFFSIVLAITMIGCLGDSNQVILYTSFDQIYSEPIVKDFEKATGIKVKAVYDSEATKTVGLVNRLIAEKKNPQADVFWNNEMGRTIVLKNKGILTPYMSPQAKEIPGGFKDMKGYWTGLAARARVLIYNTKLVPENQVPQTLADLRKPQWKGKVAMANPLFGSTATHFAALWTLWGAEETKKYCQALKANGVVLVDGNSVVRDKVGAGEYPIGLTDTDDANSGMLGGMPVKMIFLDQGEGQIGTFVMPNTVCLIKNGPNPQNGQKLIDYLLIPEVESKLAKSETIQIPLHQGLKITGGLAIDDIRAMPVDFVKVGANLETSSRFLQELLVR